ncbi:hypothetical protein D9M71_311290 [compost metagenome]
MGSLEPQAPCTAGTFALQGAAQKHAEQSVIAKYTWLTDDSDQQVRPPQRFDSCLTVITAGHGIAQRRTELSEHAGLQHESAAIQFHIAQDILEQPIQTPAIGRTKRRNPRRGCLPLGHSGGQQRERARPSLRALL